jgi:hypothetical protein
MIVPGQSKTVKLPDVIKLIDLVTFTGSTMFPSITNIFFFRKKIFQPFSESVIY